METFTELTLSPQLARAIVDMGYVKPSPIQAQALPILLEKPTDFIGLAATGTGKTAAFGIPLLEKIIPGQKVVQAIVLCPTRELCVQVAGQINLLGKHLGLRALPIYGGAGYEEQLLGLKQGAQVVVGTPGRMIDHLERGRLKLDAVHTVVLDEADEMISMGFREDMELILSKTPREQSNIWLFTATMSPSVRKVADDFLRQPKMVQVNRTEMLSSTVEQAFYLTQEKNKPEVLCKIIDAADEFYGLIFCQTKALVVALTRYLTERGYKADCLHGDMSQAAREQIMNHFRAKRLRTLVCTDVAARGLDVKDISHVINFSIPRELDIYVHRIGRTARSGQSGMAISLVTPSHRHLLGKIERLTKSKIKEGEIPTRKALGLKKIGKILDKLKAQSTFPRAVELLDENWKLAIEGMTKEEIVGRFLAQIYPEVFADRAPPQMVREERQQDDGRPPRQGQGDNRRPRHGGGGGFRGRHPAGNSRPHHARGDDRGPRPERARVEGAPPVDRPRHDDRPQRSEDPEKRKQYGVKKFGSPKKHGHQQPNNQKAGGNYPPRKKH